MESTNNIIIFSVFIILIYFVILFVHKITTIYHVSKGSNISKVLIILPYVIVGAFVIVVCIVQLNDYLNQIGNRMQDLCAKQDSLVLLAKEKRELSDSMNMKLNQLASGLKRLNVIIKKYKFREKHTKNLIDTLAQAFRNKAEELETTYRQQKKLAETSRDDLDRRVRAPKSDVTLAGTILDRITKQPIPGVDVKILDDLGIALSYCPPTDENGSYSTLIPVNVNKGKAVIKLYHTGYQSLVFNAWVGTNRMLNFDLSPR
jgi:outer membrane murein-binding lipoprotein Lpp